MIFVSIKNDFFISKFNSFFCERTLNNFDIYFTKKETIDTTNDIQYYLISVLRDFLIIRIQFFDVKKKTKIQKTFVIRNFFFFPFFKRYLMIPRYAMHISYFIHQTCTALRSHEITKRFASQSTFTMANDHLSIRLR